MTPDKYVVGQFPNYKNSKKQLKKELGKSTVDIQLEIAVFWKENFKFILIFSDF